MVLGRLDNDKKGSDISSLPLLGVVLNDHLEFVCMAVLYYNMNLILTNKCV